MDTLICKRGGIDPSLLSNSEHLQVHDTCSLFSFGSLWQKLRVWTLLTSKITRKCLQRHLLFLLISKFNCNAIYWHSVMVQNIWIWYVVPWGETLKSVLRVVHLSRVNTTSEQLQQRGHTGLQSVNVQRRVFNGFIILDTNSGKDIHDMVSILKPLNTCIFFFSFISNNTTMAITNTETVSLAT